MAGPFGVDSGGIQGLLNLSRGLWEAIEADLLVRGFTLADVPVRVTWRALLAMVHRSQHGSAVFHEMHGEVARWSNTEHVLVSILEMLQTIAWLQSDTKKNERPLPIQRPGFDSAESGLRFGDKDSAVPESEFWRIWDEPLELEPSVTE